MARDYTRLHNDQIRACAGLTSGCQIARASCQCCYGRDWTTAGACLETLPLLGQDALPHLRRQTDQQHKPHQGNQDPYCADRGRKRSRNPATIPTNLRSPEDHDTKNRPHGCHGQTQLKDDPTYQVSCGRRGRSESRQAGQGHQRNGPRCRRQEKRAQAPP